ncbi:hypothetical protein YB2330_004823 [Saitoella coloradoensis]
MGFRIYNTYLTAAVSTVGGALFGFDISSMSAIIGTSQYITYFGSPSATMQGGITASMAGGSLVGSLCSGFLSNRFGRRDSIQISLIFWVVGSIICAASQNVGMLIGGRFVNGLCVGVTSSQVPVYLAEIAKRTVRGRVIGIQQWAIEWGILIMYLIGYGCSFVDGEAAFRIPWALQMIPALFLMVAMPFLPRSPRWLGGKDRWEEAHDILSYIHAKGDKNDPVVLAELAEIRAVVELERKVKGGWLALFRGGMWKRTMVGVMTQVWQQLTGGNVMMYYTVYVFQMAGLSGNINLISSAIQYVIMLVLTVPAIFYVDWAGRRMLMLLGSLGMGAFIFAVGGILAQYGIPQPDGVAGNPNVKIVVHGSAATGVIACAYIFIAWYALTWAPTAWIYAPEVFPLSHRANGMGLAAAGNWVMNFALAFYVPPAFANIGWKTFMVFGVLCMVMFVHIFLMFPETAQKSLEEIDALFEPSAPPAWKTKVGGNGLPREAEAIDVMEKEVEKDGTMHVERVGSNHSAV